MSNGAALSDVNIDFDFGTQVELNTLALWNYNAFNASAVQRGIKDFQLILSNNSDFSSPLFTSGTLTLPIGLGTASISATPFSFATTSARYARIDVATNYGNASAIGLSEVRFANVTAVPEPLTILGTFTALGFGTAFKAKRRNDSRKETR
ncbi:MAG: PEP-CTERM sorting domain-containing protein [Geminocystis sp. GBBB08]|nr:PEP-CTERM sorting domain-containing protein [Geminocystis sp. GBBB08]